MNMLALKDMVRYAISIFIIKGTSLLMLPLVTRYLSPKEYGQLELLTVSSAFIALIASCSLSEALYRFACVTKNEVENQAFIEEKNKQRANHIFSLSLVASFALLLFMSIIASFFQTELKALAQNYDLTLVDITILCFSICIEGSLVTGLAWLRVINQVQSFTRISICTILFQSSMVIGFLELGMGVTGILIAGVITHMIQWCWVQQRTKLRFSLPSKANAIKILHYCLPLSGSALIAFGLNGAERWLILNSSNLETLGQYSIASKFALATCILVQPFCMWWMPKRFAMLDDDIKKAETFTLVGVFYIGMLVIFVATGSMIFLPWLLSADYQSATTLIFGTLFMILGKELTELVNLGLLYKKQTKVLLKINLVTTFLGLFSCILFSEFGVWSVMICIGITQLFKAFWVFHEGQRIFPIFTQVKILLFVPVIIIFFLLCLYLSKTITAISLSGLFAFVVLGFAALPLLQKRIGYSKPAMSE